MQREVAIYEYIVYCIVCGSALNLSFNAAKCVHAQIYTSVQGGIGYQVSDITSTKCSFGYFSLDTPTPFAVLTVFF